MENASKALLIAGAILLVILIIAIGMYIYNSAESNIRGSVESMSTQEVDAFNSEWTVYDGNVQGSTVKALLGRLVANANTYKDEATKVPKVTVKSFTVSGANNSGSINNVDYSNSSDIDNYVANVGKVRAAIENKHTYNVECVYGTTGLISEIVIDYNQK